MDPYDGVVLGAAFDPRWDPIRRALGHTLRCADRVDLAAMTPRADLASTGYCLAAPGKEYLVYLPEGGAVTVDLSAASNDLAVEWLDPTAGKTFTASAVPGGARREITAPFDGDAVLLLTRPAGRKP
jgi:hypothetical protein